MKIPDPEQILQIRQNIIQAFQDAGYSDAVMLSMLSTIITEYIAKYDLSGNRLEEFFAYMRKSFQNFKNE